MVTILDVKFPFLFTLLFTFRLWQIHLTNTSKTIWFYSTRMTEISKISDLSPLATCPKLTRLDLRGNPITQADDVWAELAKLLPSLTELLLWLTPKDKKRVCFSCVIMTVPLWNLIRSNHWFQYCTLHWAQRDFRISVCVNIHLYHSIVENFILIGLKMLIHFP